MDESNVVREYISYMYNFLYIYVYTEPIREVSIYSYIILNWKLGSKISFFEF